ncbi:MAG: low specificity L-threonine aldolase [Marinobacterium sp.]|nr:low specificity L-threonine aldolase [Marinobacterium sp.]
MISTIDRTSDQGGVKGGFTSDNIAGASLPILQALIEASGGTASPYGNDELTIQLEQRFKTLFECDLRLFLVPTGTAANVISLATLTPVWGSILCHPDAHINNDECSAPEFYTGGARMVKVDGRHGKLDSGLLRAAAQNKMGDVHSVQPCTVSVTQATETGHVYSLAELNEIGQICQETGMRLHMDGARFANALVALDCTPAQMTWQAGVDVLSFGATKNGVLAAEAIVLFDTGLATEMAFRRKRGGHLFSKMRVLSAQIDAYLNDDLWLHNARHANAMAQRLSRGLNAIEGIELIGETEANIIFCQMPEAVIEALQASGFQFYANRWGPEVARLVTSFSTSEREVDAFVDRAKTLISTGQGY